ncbi:hypothetical protein QAD02_011690 [Eretmocerus hayati]|uniref:Uncharacterized protein n=1 Tax=Eretmocerus hayati TaxID=131215 RepID=A0ACC2P054_9HYME|nr:hypothetical protein QAD02_011690 [Eretmocerus hayati]
MAQSSQDIRFDDDIEILDLSKKYDAPQKDDSGHIANHPPLKDITLDENSCTPPVVEEKAFEEIFKVPEEVTKKKSRKAENCPPAHFCEELVEIAEAEEKEKKLREKQVQLNKEKREKNRLMKERETSTNKSFKERKTSLQEKKKELSDQMKAIKIEMKTPEGKVKVKDLELNLHDLKMKSGDIRRKMNLSEMERLQIQIKVKQEKI